MVSQKKRKKLLRPLAVREIMFQPPAYSSAPNATLASPTTGTPRNVLCRWGENADVDFRVRHRCLASVAPQLQVSALLTQKTAPLVLARS